jgi:hypothetical protein
MLTLQRERQLRKAKIEAYCGAYFADYSVEWWEYCASGLCSIALL